jgi:Tol biopolymer transport system component
MAKPLAPAEIEAALERILSSPEWAQSFRMAQFLRYVVEQSLAGMGGQLKETVIGVGVFGRENSYDPKIDPVVRVEARRLRAKLQEYYSGSGAVDPVRIELPKGTYQPRFVPTDEPPAPAEPSPVVRSSTRAWLPWALLASAVAVAALGWVLFRPPSAPPSAPRLVTGHQFYSRSPAFSPDGTMMAFSRDSGSNRSHIFLVPAAGGATQEIDTGAALDYEPAWSPDGKRLSFLRMTGPGAYQVIVREIASGVETTVRRASERSAPLWLPSGQALIIAHRDRPELPASLLEVPVAGGAARVWTTAPPRSQGDAHPRLSPDGQQIAFVRTMEQASQDIWLLTLASGQVRRVTAEQRPTSGLCWHPSGRSLIVSMARGSEVGSLWQFPLDGGTPQRLAEAGLSPLSPAAALHGGRLAFVVRLSDTNLWRAPSSGGEAMAITSSTALDTSPQISPDGQWIAWRSTSSGTNEVWVARSDGSEARQLTQAGGPVTGSPRWSPDGTQIVFESRTAGNADLFVIPLAGGAARPLTSEPSSEVLPSWSPDGTSIYFASDRSGQWQVWRMPASGGAAVQVTREGGFAAFESYDQGWVYYCRQSSPGIWRVPREGGPEKLVTPELAANLWGQWALSQTGLFYAVFPPKGQRAIMRQDLATGQTTVSRLLNRLPVQYDSGMGVTRDESLLVWSQLDQAGSDIYVVDHFR